MQKRKMLVWKVRKVGENWFWRGLVLFALLCSEKTIPPLFIV